MTGRVFLALLLAVPAVSGLGKNLSGMWSVQISLLPTPALHSTALSLGYATPRWSVTSTSEFASPWDWVWQEFAIKATSPLAGVSGDILYGPAVPDFLYAQLIADMGLGGADFRLYTALAGPALGGPLGGVVIQSSVPIGRSTLTAAIGFGASLPEDGFTIYHVSGLSKTYVTDPRPGGFQFTQAEVSVTGLSLCCGVTHDFELSFTKAGFQHAEFTVKSLPFCCGISFDAAVRFTATAKQVSLTPKWAGIGTACIVAYGDVRYQTATQTWEGIEIYGWKIRCELGDCVYIEFLTALDVGKVEEILDDDSIFAGNEFQYVKLAFCGPGCCGRTYSLGVAVYFQPSGGLFGFSRLAADLEIPIMANLTVNVAFTSVPALSFGWTFTF